MAEAPAIAKSAAPPDGKSLLPELTPELLPELERLVRGLAGRLHARLPRGCGIDVSDLVQAGNIGLLQAASSFDPRHGASLAGFAKFRIRGEMIDMVRRHVGRNRAQPPARSADSEAADWESRIPAAAESSPQYSLLQRERAEIISQELSRLPARHRTVVRLRYSREMTLQQIGTELRVNESRACQIHRNALDRLKKALSNRGVRGFSQL
ncbi:MAG: sigma-70 family RNA polymerase sigma factor [Acidobacteriota bacterium]|nr:sigma-70 family RNA polymerase sigma factor [Acidobacteriota bacterium]